MTRALTPEQVRPDRGVSVLATPGIGTTVTNASRALPPRRRSVARTSPTANTLAAIVAGSGAESVLTTARRSVASPTTVVRSEEAPINE